jgi:hypothetical protein
MTSEKTPNTTHFIREIQKLARLADELSWSTHEMGAELDRLQQLLCMREHFNRLAPRSNRPN